jgi:hypothetical protein
MLRPPMVSMEVTLDNATMVGFRMASMADGGNKKHAEEAITGSYSPTGWKKWCEAVKAGNVESSPELNRFAARYRAANLFDGIQLKPRASDDLRRGYSALLKVFLAYTAAESLRDGLRASHRSSFRINLISSPLAKSLRRNSKLLALLEEEVEKYNKNKKKVPPLLDRLQRFRSAESDDVGSVAQAIRHLVAHGVLTVGGANATTIERAASLTELAEEMLKLCNGEFSNFCSKNIPQS